MVIFMEQPEHLKLLETEGNQCVVYPQLLIIIHKRPKIMPIIPVD